MNAHDTTSDVDIPMCQIWLANVKPEKSYGPDTKTCQKPNKFECEVKVQVCIWITNVRVTSSYGDGQTG